MPKVVFLLLLLSFTSEAHANLRARMQAEADANAALMQAEADKRAIQEILLKLSHEGLRSLRNTAEKLRHQENLKK